MIKTICDSVNHTRFPKDDNLPDWAHRDNKVTKSDCVDYRVILRVLVINNLPSYTIIANAAVCIAVYN